MQNTHIWYIRYHTIALELKKNEKSVYLHNSASLSNQKSKKSHKIIKTIYNLQMHKRIINKIQMQNRHIWYIRYQTIALELKKNEKLCIFVAEHLSATKNSKNPKNYKNNLQFTNAQTYHK